MIDMYYNYSKIFLRLKMLKKLICNRFVGTVCEITSFSFLVSLMLLVESLWIFVEKNFKTVLFAN